MKAKDKHLRKTSKNIYKQVEGRKLKGKKKTAPTKKILPREITEPLAAVHILLILLMEAKEVAIGKR